MENCALAVNAILALVAIFEHDKNITCILQQSLLASSIVITRIQHCHYLHPTLSLLASSIVITCIQHSHYLHPAQSLLASSIVITCIQHSHYLLPAQSLLASSIVITCIQHSHYLHPAQSLLASNIVITCIQHFHSVNSLPQSLCNYYLSLLRMPYNGLHAHGLQSGCRECAWSLEWIQCMHMVPRVDVVHAHGLQSGCSACA